MKTAIIYHPDFKEYDFGINHPFHGDRYSALPEIFASQSICGHKADLTFVTPNSASQEVVNLVHGEDYLELLDTLNSRGGFLSMDTPIHPGIYDIAKLLSGAGILAGRLVVENIFKRAIVLGGGAHHAGFDFGGGFCLINDIAITVEYLRQFYGLKKIAIIDLDAHCGNGTQDIFYEDSDILCIDIHEDPLYLFPGTGFAWQIGLRGGKGFTVNVPLPQGSGDHNALYVFHEICIPIITEFMPQLIIVFGGIDGHFADPLSHLHMTLNGLFNQMRTIIELANTLCSGKMVLILGHSYDAKIFPLAWEALIGAVLGNEMMYVKEPYKIPEMVSGVNELVSKMTLRLKTIHERYWRQL